MDTASVIVQHLASALADRLAALAADRKKNTASLSMSGAATIPAELHTLADLDRNVLERLTREALANGLTYEDVVLSPVPDVRVPSSGSTARVVAFTRQPVSFAIKIDDDRKLVREARTLRQTKSNSDLPPELRDALPTVYAIRDDAPPYAYLFQYFEGYRDLADVIFDKKAGSADTSRRVLDRALDILFKAYEATEAARDFPVLPDARGIYLNRMIDRVREAKGADATFGLLLTKPIRVAGLELAPLESILKKLDEQWQSVGQVVTAPFTTYVHGDIHPENILAKFSPSGTNVKIVDPKEWGWGDYVFDVAKLVHYLLVTGPAEKVKDASALSIELDVSQSEVVATIVGECPAVCSQLSSQVIARMVQFAGLKNDSGSNLRLSLAMASNLIGLTPGRLKKGMRKHAELYLIEGMKQLHGFVKSLPSGLLK